VIDAITQANDTGIDGTFHLSLPYICIYRYRECEKKSVVTGGVLPEPSGSSSLFAGVKSFSCEV